jgi:hypothetical protein
MELVNDGDRPIALAPGIRIAQLAIHRLQTPAPAREDEQEKYLAPVRPQPSQLASEKDLDLGGANGRVAWLRWGLGGCADGSFLPLPRVQGFAGRARS